MIARGGLLPLAAVRGWPHRETLPLLWTAWQAGGPAWLVTVGPGVVVGECAAKGPLVPGAPAEIGYGLAPGVRGRGYGRAMVSELVSTLVGAGVAEIWARTEVGNVASRRLLERAGFRLSRAAEDASNASSVCYILPAETIRAGSPAIKPLPTTEVEGEHPAVTLHAPDVT